MEKNCLAFLSWVSQQTLNMENEVFHTRKRYLIWGTYLHICEAVLGILKKFLNVHTCNTDSSLSLLESICFRKRETFSYYGKLNLLGHGFNLRKLFIMHKNSFIAMLIMNSDRYYCIMAENAHYSITCR